MLQTVFGVRQQWNPKLKFMGILANRFMHNSTRQKAALQELFENYQDYVLPLKISTRAAIPRALEEGRGVWQLPTGRRSRCERRGPASVRGVDEENGAGQ